ncbi:MAG: hypothetical protein Q9M97_01975 [Candidatus Gracilibacteria bacterium]|nr:hypothetical protein [Candidatus Gracilibacteria bacterium]
MATSDNIGNSITGNTIDGLYVSNFDTSGTSFTLGQDIVSNGGTLSSGKTLTIDPGVIIKVMPGRGIKYILRITIGFELVQII